MAELRDQIHEIISKPQLAGLATVTPEGTPWVRYVMTVAAEDLSIHFATFIQARKVEHIKANPEVHLTCGVTNPMEMTPYLQIQGKASLRTDEEIRHAFWSDMLAPIFDGPDDPKYGVVEVMPYRIEYCTPGSYEPQVWMA
jgi:general stress protein 26